MYIYTLRQSNTQTHKYIPTLALRLECSPMARETGVQSQVESYQRFKKWYLMPPCLTLSIIRYGSRVKWSNPGKGVVPSPTPRCSSYRKGSLRVTLDYVRQLYLYIYIYIYIYMYSYILEHVINIEGIHTYIHTYIHTCRYLYILQKYLKTDDKATRNSHLKFLFFNIVSFHKNTIAFLKLILEMKD